MKNDVIYSSEFACDNITRRELRDLDKLSTRGPAVEFATNLMVPLGNRIISSGRLKRGVLKPLIERVKHKLMNEQGIIGVELDSFCKSKLSANEEYRFAFLAGNGGDENWLGFYAIEAQINRKEISVRMSGADIRMHRHALSRFMQREQRPARDIYPQLLEVVRASSMIAEAAAANPERQIAIAIGDGGLLLGRVYEKTWEEAPTAVELIAINKDGPSRHSEVRSDMLESPYRYVVDIMTYVDHNSLVDSRMALRDVLRDYQNRRALEMKMLFDAVHFHSALVPAEMAEDHEERLFAAAREMRDIVAGPEWTHFAKTAPKSLDKRPFQSY